MAVNVCTEISSPRISFSHDVVPIDDHNRRSSDPLLLTPTVDFDFCIGPHEISSADELFADGKILPVGIKEIIKNPPKQTSPTTHPNDVVLPNENTKKKRLIEFLSTSFDEEDEKRLSSKPFFWQFRRSSSMNGDNGPRPNGLIRSFNFLTRSNSTGSVPNPKPNGFSKAIRKQHSMKEGSINCSHSSSGFNRYYYYYPYHSSNSSSNSSSNNNSNDNTTSSKRPWLRKSMSRSSSYGNNNNGVRISPVLNIHPSYIAKGGVSFFGIGSFFCSKKSKKKRK